MMARPLPATTRILWVLAAVAIGTGGMPARAQVQTSPSGTDGVYHAPEKSERLTLEPGATLRPLLGAVRSAAAAFDQRTWNKITTQEIGLATFDRFENLFEKERIQRITASFREGYSQVYVNLPEAIIVTAVEMDDAAAATDYYRMEIQSLQVTLDGINQSEDGRAEVTLEEDIALADLDQGFDKRYEVRLGDSPPSQFRVLFGRAGRYTMLVTFLQSSVGDDEARDLLRLLAGEVHAVASATRAPATPPQAR
ncbi:MAG: hypothetical protein ACE5IK_06670 [Acidobacteriota bacterium]